MQFALDKRKGNLYLCLALVKYFFASPRTWGGEEHFGQFKREVMIVSQDNPRGEFWFTGDLKGAFWLT